MDAALIRLVWQRAKRRCEYCQVPQELDEAQFEVDHIVARKHGGATVSSNLALSCFHDNSHKGSNIAGIDPTSREMVPLFNPRRQSWRRHFRWEGAYLVGRWQSVEQLLRF
jgi:5-methylcytosine-specific restriction endonuclease McrA